MTTFVAIRGPLLPTMGGESDPSAHVPVTERIFTTMTAADAFVAARPNPAAWEIIPVRTS